MVLTPYTIKMEPKMKVWKMSFLFIRVIFRSHVNFQGGHFPLRDVCEFSEPMGVFSGKC